MTGPPNRSESEIMYRSLRAQFRRHRRRGEFLPEFRELAGVFEELLGDAAEEESLRPGGGDDVLGEAIGPCEHGKHVDQDCPECDLDD